MGVDSWDEAERFFDRFSGDADLRGEFSRIGLGLLRGCRERWCPTMEARQVVGFGLRFEPRGLPSRTNWVQVEHRIGAGRPTVGIELWDTRTFLRGGPGQLLRRESWSGKSLPFLVTGDLCTLPTVPAVLDAFLLQLPVLNRV